MRPSSLPARRMLAVPGSGWSLRNVTGGITRHGADPVAGALALRDQTRRLDPSARVAVVMWLGYDTPERIDRQAMRSDRAVAGARALSRFIQGLPPGAHVSLLCHSYGTELLANLARIVLDRTSEVTLVGHAN